MRAKYSLFQSLKPTDMVPVVVEHIFSGGGKKDSKQTSKYGSFIHECYKEIKHGRGMGNFKLGSQRR